VAEPKNYIYICDSNQQPSRLNPATEI